MSRPVAALALACLLVLSGCNAGDPSAPAETATPAPVPTDEPTPVAPGIDPDGTLDPATLAAGHAAALSNVSYTVVRNRTVTGPNGTVRSRRTLVGAFEPAGRRYRIALEERRAGDTPREVVLVYTGQRVVREVTTDNRTDRELLTRRTLGGDRTGPREALFFDPLYRDRLRGAFAAAGSVAVTRVTGPDPDVPAGATAFRVRADLADVPTENGTVDDATLVALVGADGVVYEHTLAYAVERDGARLRVVDTVRYVEVGETAVIG